VRDFRVLWAGQVVSDLGTRVSGVAYPLLTLALTHSATKAGIVGFAAALPLLLLTLHAGALVDRYDRKRLMLACEGARAIALGSIGIGVLAGFASFEQLVAVALIDGIGFTVFEVAQRAALRQLVPVEELPNAAAMNQGREYGALLVGMPLGGALYGVSRSIPFLADGISYAVSFASLLLIRRPLNDVRATDTGEGRRLREEIGEGVLWLWRQPFLRTASLLVIASDLTVNALFLAVVVLARRHGASPELIGAMLLFIGAGGIVGALLAPLALRRLPAHAGIYGTLVAMTALLPLIAFVRDPLLLGVLYGAMFVPYPTWGAMISAYRAALVPDHLQGRVQSVATLLSLGAVPFAVLAVGAALQHIGGVSTVLALFVLMLGATACALTSKHIRNAPQLAARS
jgi:MFS family permease